MTTPICLHSERVRCAPRAVGAALLGLTLLSANPVRAESGYDAWLRYAPIAEAARSRYASLPGSVVALGNSMVVSTAREELTRGVRSMLGRELIASPSLGGDSA